MSYEDLTSSFTYKSLLNYQKGQLLVSNDNHLRDYLMKYRRPNLIWIDNQTIDIENNVQNDANATMIIFPDGDVRTVSENTAVSHQYRRIKRSDSPSLTATHDSGLSTTNIDNWVPIYAVKTTDDATKFVLVGNQLLPILSNFSALNSAYGSSGWLYLGLIHTGRSDNNFMKFRQSGNTTIFLEYTTGATGSGIPKPGPFMSAGVSVTSRTYSYSAGFGVEAIPNNIKIACFGASASLGNNIDVTNAAGTAFYFSTGTGSVTSPNFSTQIWCSALTGFRIASSSSCDMEIKVVGYIDDALGIGSNPEF